MNPFLFQTEADLSLRPGHRRRREFTEIPFFVHLVARCAGRPIPSVASVYFQIADRIVIRLRKSRILAIDTVLRTSWLNKSTVVSDEGLFVSGPDETSGVSTNGDNLENQS